MAAAVPSDHHPLSHPQVRTWVPDLSHYPEQLTPLSATVWLEAIGFGLHEALRDMRAPFAGFIGRTHLGWAYEGELPVEWEPDADVMRGRMVRLPVEWETTIRPRVHSITADLHQLRPEDCDGDGAVAVLDRMWALVTEQWILHFDAVIPAQFAIEEFTEQYGSRFGSDDPLAPYRLLEESGNESLAADDELVALAAEARERGVAGIVVAYPPETVVDRLRELHDGRTFLHAVDRYLLRFGGRSRWHELSLPREVENPVMTFQSLRLFLEGNQRLRATSGEVSRERAQLVEHEPEIASAMELATSAYALKESHVYHIDYPGLLATREVLLGFGRRLVADGTLPSVDDVWMFTRLELRSLVSDDHDLDISAVVAQRSGELDQGRRDGVLPYLGEPPAAQGQHAVQQKFYGRPGGSVSARSVRGSGASPGVAQGPARLISAPADFERVQPGDVLVALTTTPAWTPLFPSLAGLVTETGGILSHAAIVAREYGIPAVVGASQATDIIPEGAQVRVDGSAGVVEVE
jgi:rifampicin phosphotransferase